MTASSKVGRLTNRYGPSPMSLSVAAQPMGLAPPYLLGLRSRATAHSRRCERRVSFRSFLMIERAIWRLAPTHHSKVYWGT
jgi:hypothetical protein